MMNAMRLIMAGAWLAFWLLAASALAPTIALASTPAVDPAATQILKRMTDYLAGLSQFSLDTYNIFEEVLDSEQKIQYDLSSRVLVKRPNKLRAERTGDLANDLVVYDGKTLAVYSPGHEYYAEADAPDNIEDALHFARDVLDIVPPSGDLIYRNAYELLTASLTSGMVVGKSEIDGVRCDHLAFRNPVVDWQIWIADGDEPLPMKYVITTTDDPALPQYMVLMSNWNTAPSLKAGAFELSPPEAAQKTDFIRRDTGQPLTQ